MTSKSHQIPYMQRRVPKSDKYDHVQGRLDTGLTVAKVRTISASEYARRRDEVFFRITPAQLFELFCEYENEDEENIDGPAFSSSGSGAPRIVTYSDTSAADYSKPYLILDVREDFEYRTCHIQQARTYPAAMMRRDYVHPELYSFRNKSGHLIIVYCDDERVSCEAAKVLVGRGTDNIYLLTGGMKEFYSHFPTYIEGNPPAGFVDTSKRRATEQSHSHLSSRATGTADSSVPTTARLRAHAAATGGGRTSRGNTSGGDTRSVSAMSGVSTASVAESIISRASARKGKF